MVSTTSRVGYGLAKAVGITLDDGRHEAANDKLTRGESVYSVSSADMYVETEPTSWEWMHEMVPRWRDVGRYGLRLVPFVHWITRYNGAWFFGDLVAGVSIPSSSGDDRILTVFRRHGGSGRGAAIHGLRGVGAAAARVWSLFVLHGRLHVLVLCYFQRHHHRGGWDRHPS